MKKGLFSLLPLLLLSCYTLTTKIEVDSPKEIYFKKGQEYSSRGQYKEAISTYELFIERYPDDTPNVYTALYEIGYSYYKARKYIEAKEHLTPLLSVPPSAPSWIPILSARTLESIEVKTTPKKKEKKTPQSEKHKENADNQTSFSASGNQIAEEAEQNQKPEEGPERIRLFPPPASEEDPLEEANFDHIMFPEFDG